MIQLSFSGGGGVGGEGFVDIKKGLFTFFPLRKLEEYWLTNNDNSERNNGEQGGDDTALNGAHLAGELNLQAG
jgi:hypothetical protein